ncbi:MAG TPA: hypothetical protein VHO06_18695 [Polyangia bacterium]|nr:hypothetical protein [Polyangia bacterium]
MRRPFARALLVAGLLAAGCKPDLGAPPSLVTGPRLLAIRGTPPEASEGGAVSYDVLAVDVTGTVAAPDLGWLQCLDPDPPAEVNDVSNTCLGEPDDAGPTPTFMADLPTDACMLFGPETPSPVPGKPAQRPADPDTTGGFYQPIRASWQSAGLVAFALERITCPLVQAPGPAATQFAMQYLPNTNPTLADLVLDPSGASASLYTAGQTAPPPAATVAAGTKVTLEADFTSGSAETFLYWDIVALALVQQRESLRVSWFATGGAFDLDTTGRTSAETETFTQNGWTAPTTPGPVYFWTVLNDSRGGVDFAAAEIDVTP